MKILMLCNKSPWPAIEGGPMAMNNMAEGLIQAGHQVKILAVNSFKYNIDPKQIPEDYRIHTISFSSKHFLWPLIFMKSGNIVVPK